MRRASAIRLALLACLWGASFLFIKVALRGLSPVQIVLGRLALGAAVLLIVVALRREPLPRSPIVWWHLAVAAVVANIVPYFLFGWGEQRTSSALAGVLNATTPLFTLVFALATRTEPRTTAVRLAGLLLGFVGALTVLAPWQVGSGQGSLSGQAACLLAAACYGVAFVYMRRFLTGRGQYTDDITLANQSHAVFVRSPHAHAKFKIDASAAKAMPGIAAVLKDAPDLGALPKDTPPAVMVLIGRCLEKDPARRPSSATRPQPASRPCANSSVLGLCRS